MTPAGDGMRVETSPGGARLEDGLVPWQELAAEALEPNVFYEPEALLPALQHLQGARPVEVWRVWRGERLVGLWPVVREPRYRGLPVARIAGWKHLHCFLGTPLLDRRWAVEALAALFEHARGRRESLLELPDVGGGGPLEAALVQAAAAAGVAQRVTESHERALYRPREDADAHLRAAMPSRHRRKEIRRLSRRLAEAGPVDVQTFAGDADLDAWLRDFLALEGSGWKGRGGTAIADRPEERAFFESVARELARTGHLGLFSLRVAGRPIAMKCNFLARAPKALEDGGAGRGFCFKIAYDEAWSRYSPGVLLELEHVAQLHAARNLDWLDSCAVPGHPMIERLWPDRRRIATILVGTGRRGRWLVRHHEGLRRLAAIRSRRGRRDPPSGRSPDATEGREEVG